MPSVAFCVTAFRSIGSGLSRYVIAFPLAGTLLIVGCLGAGGPAVELHAVRGRVEFEGKPPAGARVTLHPKGSDWQLNALPVGLVGEDGAVQFGTLTNDDGAPAGDYVATVQWFRVEPDGSVGGNALPSTYASPSSSPLEVSVVPGQPDLPPLRLSR